VRCELIPLGRQDKVGKPEVDHQGTWWCDYSEKLEVLKQMQS
jgi:hypothetical protein